MKLGHGFNFACRFRRRHGLLNCNQHGKLFVLLLMQASQAHIHFHDQVRVYTCERQIGTQHGFCIFQSFACALQITFRLHNLSDSQIKEKLPPDIFVSFHQRQQCFIQPQCFLALRVLKQHERL